MADGERVGRVSHYFGKISVAVLDLEKGLNIGERVHFLGRHTDFQQEINSMQIEHESVESVEAGQDVAVKVIKRVRRGDSVYRLTAQD